MSIYQPRDSCFSDVIFDQHFVDFADTPQWGEMFFEEVKKKNSSCWSSLLDSLVLFPQRGSCRCTFGVWLLTTFVASCDAGESDLGHDNLKYQTLLKVRKSQKHFFLNSIAQKMDEIFDKILPYKARAEFCQIFCLFFGQWSFKEKWFWDLLTFILAQKSRL